MSLLRGYPQGDAARVLMETSVESEIADALARIGVVFERWPVGPELSARASPEDVLRTCARQAQRLACRSFDVMRMTAEHSERERLREQFLREHTHSADEVRLFVEGRGLFCLRTADRVYQLLCEAGDLIRVPAGLRHWFDMGPKPKFSVIRGFDSRKGWVPVCTGSEIASRFPRVETFTQRESESAVLIDVEGTVSPIEFVRDVLVPYARGAIRSFVEANAESESVRAAIRETCREGGSDARDREAAVAQLLAWSDADEKRTPLKDLQGLIWEAGYRDGSLVAPLYADARERLASWRELGIPLYVFSSGSVKAQELFFAHTDAGDISEWFAGHFDTRSGRKDDPRSYQAIAKAIGKREGQVVFLSDSAAEIRAARFAGLRAQQIVRSEIERDFAPGALELERPRYSSLRDIAL